MNWELKTLDELGFVGRGRSRHRPRGDQKLYGGNYPFIQTGDVQKAEFYIKEHSQTYSDFGFEQSKLWPKGTLCISIVGANTAESAILGIDACFPDSIIGFIASEEIADTIFVKYYLDTIKVQMKTISEGAARENLSMDKLLFMKLKVPEVETQKKIASILSAYDDLIENNKQRIKLLEEMAEEIYKEWFVRMRFPGYKEAVFIDKNGNKVAQGTKGALPEGWEDGTLGELVEFKKGKNITLNTVKEGNVPVVAGGLSPAYYHNMPNTVSPTITVSASGANAGYVNLYYEDIWASDCSFVDTNTTDYVYFVYSLLKTRQKEVFHLQKGSAQPHVYPKDIMSLSMLMPKKELIKDFQKLIVPFYEEIKTLKNKNQILQETRDLLLPRLISGKLSVEHLNGYKIENNQHLNMAAEPENEYSKGAKYNS